MRFLLNNLDDLDTSSMTPMLQQYYDLKKSKPDAILFFRMGDFFEVFGEDAETVAPLLGIVLTSRERGDKKKIGFCGVPHHSARNYWMKLLGMNYKVAIADQVEEASQAKGLVKREIVKVLTPACIDELEGLDLFSSNYLLAAYEDPKSKKWSALVCDVSTGEMRLGGLNSSEDVFQILENYGPKELLLRKFCHQKFSSFLQSSEKLSSVLLGELDESVLADKKKQNEILKDIFGDSASLDNTFSKLKGGEALVSSVLSYLKSLHFNIQHFRTIKPLFDSDTKTLDASVVRDLELLETVRGHRKKGSLFHAICQTLTPMGARLLRHSLINLFIQKEKILERQSKVENFIGLGGESILALRKRLEGCGDLERLNTRIASFNIRPYELAKVAESLEKIDEVSKLLCKSKNPVALSFEEGLEEHRELLNLLKASLLESPSALGQDFKVFKPGYDKELDHLLEFYRGGQEKINEYQEVLRDETGISNLKIKPHKTYGLLVEVSKANLKKVPESFIRRQTMVNCDRFLTENLKDLDETLSSARDKALLREQELYLHLLGLLQKKHDLLVRVSSVMGELDLVLSFAWLALNESYTKPVFTESENLELIQARHPVVEQFIGSSSFVANDIVMDAHSKVLLITGPNMAGKSTIMRQTALCAVLAQMGSYVPCERALLPVFDNIYTRVGASDDLSRGLSTFMVEMKEASHILRHATTKSLVILDEVGRGTSTEDGLSLAHGILDFIAQKLGSWTLFATHYHELAKPSLAYSNVKLVHTKVVEKNDSVEFTHELIEGSSGSSYGLQVAKIAGIPNDVILFAQKIINKKEARTPSEGSNTIQEKTKISDFKSSEKVDLRSEEILTRLANLNLNRTTPIQALNILNDLVVISQNQPAQSLFRDGQSFF